MVSRASRVGPGCTTPGTVDPHHWFWATAGGPAVFAPFCDTTDEFAADKAFMIDFRVDDRDAMLDRLTAAGVAIIANDERNAPEAGRFARIHDPEGKAINPWKPSIA